MDSTMNPKGERIRNWGTVLGSQHFRGRGGIGVPGWGLGRMTSKLITHTNLHKLNNKLVSA
jgi:hypothetical protein